MDYADQAEVADPGGRVWVQDFHLALLPAAGAIATKHIHRLGGQSDMANHRDSAVSEKIDRRGYRLAAFEFHGRAAGFLHDPRR